MILKLAPYVIIAALLAGGGFYVANLRADNAAKDADLKRQAVIIEKQIEVQRQHRVYIERVEQERREWEQLASELDELEGGHAELSDYLRNAVGRVLQR